MYNNSSLAVVSTYEEHKSISYLEEKRKKMKRYAIEHPLPMFMQIRSMKGILGFRESALLIKISEETGTEIKIYTKGKKCSTKSIMSMVKMGLKPGELISVEFRDGDIHSAFKKAKEVLDGITIQ